MSCLHAGVAPSPGPLARGCCSAQTSPAPGSAEMAIPRPRPLPRVVGGNQQARWFLTSFPRGLHVLLPRSCTGGKRFWKHPSRNPRARPLWWTLGSSEWSHFGHWSREGLPSPLWKPGLQQQANAGEGPVTWPFLHSHAAASLCRAHTHSASFSLPLCKEVWL